MRLFYVILVAVIVLIAYIMIGGRARAEYFITYNPGGHIADFQKELASIEQSGERVRIEGECDSACTMILKLSPDRMCVGPWARFGFHTAFGVRKDGRHIFSPQGTQLLLNTYPPRVLEWIRDQGGLREKLIYLEGDDLHRLLPDCPKLPALVTTEAFREARLAYVTISPSAVRYQRTVPVPLPRKRPSIERMSFNAHTLY